MPRLSQIYFAAGDTNVGSTPISSGTRQIRGYFTQPPVPGQPPPTGPFERFQRYDISTAGNWNAGGFEREFGSFDRAKLRVRGGLNRYTGEIEPWGSRYEIRDDRWQTIGYLDTWGSFHGELSVKDRMGREVGIIRDIFNDGSMMRLVGDADCVALFAKLGINLKPGMGAANREQLRKAIFERMAK